jgi:hypothetical protein
MNSRRECMVRSREAILKIFNATKITLPIISHYQVCICTNTITYANLDNKLLLIILINYCIVGIFYPKNKCQKMTI